MANSNNVRYKNTHPVWTTLGIIFLVLILCAGVTALVGWLGFGWFTNDEDGEVIEDDLEGGTRDDNNYQGSIYLSTFKIEEDDYEEYGVNPLAESAYTLKATLTGDNIYDIRVDWRVYWDESYTGNDDVTDYVTLNDYSNAAQEVVLSCLQPFGYNIYVEAYRTAYPDISAVCKLDYVAKGESIVSAVFNQDTQSIDLIHTDTIGVGTITGSFSFTNNVSFIGDAETFEILDQILTDAFPGCEISYWRHPISVSSGSTVEPYSFADWLSYVSLDRGSVVSSTPLLYYSSSSLVYSDFIFYLADALSYSSNTSFCSYIKIDGEMVSSTDLVSILYQADWNFYISGLLRYETSISYSDTFFATDCTFKGSELDLIEDGATLVVDQENIIFGV